MPHHRSRSKITNAAAASAGLWLARGTTAAGFDGSNSVAIYWGQNSYNQGSGDLAQQRLSTYCANTDIDIIPMAFLVQVTSGQGEQPVINFANQQNNCTVFPDTGLVDCAQIGDDIKTCQQKYGKKILLSIGGATYTEGGFASKDAAIAAANLVWSTFGPSADAPSANASSSVSPSAAANSTSLVGSAHSATIVNSTTPALSTGGTGQVAATTLSLNASTSLLPTLSTALGVNSSTTAEHDEVKKTGKLTTASATTSDREVLTVATTFVTTLKKSTFMSTKTLKHKPAATSSEASHSTKTDKEMSVESHSTASYSVVNVEDKAVELSPTHSHSIKTSSSASHSMNSDEQRLGETSSHHTHSAATFRQNNADASSSVLLEEKNSKTSTTAPLKTRTHGVIHRTHGIQDIASSKSSTATTSSHKPATTEAGAETLDYDVTHPHYLRQAKALRPFHDAVIDGFDLDLETAVQNFNPFATQLRTLMDADTSKKYYLTAAPQCPYPDAADDSMLNGGAGGDKVKFDAVGTRHNAQRDVNANECAC